MPAVAYSHALTLRKAYCAAIASLAMYLALPCCIVETFCMSEQTIKTHPSRLFKKLNIATEVQLILLAQKVRRLNFIAGYAGFF
jgi:hypothetical protein